LSGLEVLDGRMQVSKQIIDKAKEEVKRIIEAYQVRMQLGLQLLYFWQM
jgi:hypothetical protein